MGKKKNSSRDHFKGELNFHSCHVMLGFVTTEDNFHLYLVARFGCYCYLNT